MHLNIEMNGSYINKRNEIILKTALALFRSSSVHMSSFQLDSSFVAWFNPISEMDNKYTNIFNRIKRQDIWTYF